MSLTYLQISDFRNISSAKLDFCLDGFSIISGNNGCGKTSLLESIYYLSLGRSFRSSNVGHIIHNSADKFTIYSEIAHHEDQTISVGLERARNGVMTARIAGKEVSSISDLADKLPVQLINSQCHHLLDSGPQFRRNYLDWGVFHHETEFLEVWRQFKRILKQRNAALGEDVSKNELDPWDYELSQIAPKLHQFRLNYVNQLFPMLESMLNELLPSLKIKLDYYPGWDIDVDFQQVLKASYLRDKHLGYSQFGPQRANLNMFINGLPAKDILSRGQQKLFVCAMILTQGALLFQGRNKRPIYLIDDLPSELDHSSRHSLITLLSKQAAQIFITAVERKGLESCLMTKSVKMFHVEHGSLTSIVE